MNKLSQQQEKELIIFIKDWLKAHGYSQKDLANQLNIKSSRTSEIALKIKEFYKKGGIFNVAKKLIRVEQNWLKDIQDNPKNKNEAQPYSQLNLTSTSNESLQSNKLELYKSSNDSKSYNQLDIDSVVNQINKDTSE